MNTHNPAPCKYQKHSYYRNAIKGKSHISFINQLPRPHDHGH